MEDNLIIAFDPVDLQFEMEGKNKLDVYHRSRNQKYVFDHVYTQEPTRQIYEETAKSLVEPLFDGFNGCVFAYGATGTGKTYTMIGND